VRNLIIGGSGFVGRNLARRLTAQGDEVTVLDRIPDSTGSFSGECVLGDAQDTAALVALIDRIRPQTVYHLAANSDIQAGVADASLDFGDTLMTTIALRTALQDSPVERLVFASSSAIFGISQQAFAESSTTPPAPVSWYGKAKLASEFVLESLAAAQPDLGILVVRFPNVVGPLATHGVVFDFIRRLRVTPGQLDVLGDGNQTKPYVHVAELIDGIAYFAQELAPGLKRVNIGPVDEIDVKGIVQEVTGALGLEPTVTYQDSPFGWVGDVPRYSFDTSLMQREGFAIATTSRQAVRRAAEDLAVELTA
jgi:UDP-glucose 4-epimerase